VFYYLSQYLLEETAGTELGDLLSPLRVFRYITFRTAGGALTALLLSLWFGPTAIAWLKRLCMGQNYKDAAEEAGDLKARIVDKRGTPTMGGLLIVVAIDLSALLWAQWNQLTVLSLLALLVLALLGFVDDYVKIAHQSSKGINAKVKLAVQFLSALFVAFYLYNDPHMRKLVTEVVLPFWKYPVTSGGAVLGGVVTVLTIVGSSNAVNLTDGLDGLAIGCTAIVVMVFLVLTYIAGHARFAAYLQVPYVAGAGELTVLCGAVFGASLGFLWFNCHPAQVFMGDTGSLALGGLLGIIAVLIQQPFALFIAGGVFVLEAVSVILQVLSARYSRKYLKTDKRLFLRAPIHHHFEKKGWYESKVVIRFYILSILCAVVALATLKMR